MVVDGTLQVPLSGRIHEAHWARGPRARALVIDLVIWFALSFVVNSVYGVTQIQSGYYNPGSGFAFYTSSTGVEWGWLGLMWLAYYTIPELLFGATPGKLFVGLRVVRVDGKRLGAREVVVRNLMRIIDYLPFFFLLGGVAVLASAKSQRLGDMLAGTTVVTRANATEPGATRTSSPRVIWFAVIAMVSALVFTIAFDYFGRPPLVVQGMFNEHQLLGGDVTSYELGTAQWSPGRVTYPITIYKGQNRCTGSAQMDWSFWVGWELDSAQYQCAS